MKVTETLKSVLAWVGLVALIPNALAIFTTAGVWRSLFICVFITLLVLLWRWRALINSVRNTETLHSIHIVNSEGDARYERGTSLLPLLWPIREIEVFISFSNEGAAIKDIESNCKIHWTKREKNVWHGKAKLPSHRPLLFSFGRPAGTRIELKALLGGAYLKPPYDFVVATGERPSSRILISMRWGQGNRPIEVFAQETPYPTEHLRKVVMVDTTKVPWKNLEMTTATTQGDGSSTYVFKIDEPRRHFMYRVYWKPPQVSAPK